MMLLHILPDSTFVVVFHTPVTMRIVIPALWQVATASGTSSLTGSLMPTMAITIRFRSVLSGFSKKSEGLCFEGDENFRMDQHLGKT